MIKKNRSMVFILMFDAILFLICITGIYHISQKAALPFQLEKKNNKLVVVSNSSNISSITKNDILNKVNGYNVHDIEEVECITDGISIGDEVEVLVKRQNAEIEIQLKAISYYTSDYLIIASFVSLFFFVIGIFVLIKRPNLRSAKLFHAGAISTAIIITTTWGNYNVEPQGLGYLLRLLFSAAYSFAPTFFVDFVLSLRQRKRKGYKFFRSFLYSVASIFFLLQAVSFINFVNLKTIASIHQYLSVFSIFRIYLIVYLIIGLAIFIYTYNSTIEEYERKKLRWILYGFSVGVTGLLALWIIPYLITSRGLVPEELLLLIVLFIPVTFAISIVRYRWLDIDLIIKRSIVYAAAIILLLLTYVLLVVFITEFLKIDNSNIPTVITVLLVAVFFQPVNLKLQEFVNKKFFRIQYNFKEVLTSFIDDIKLDNSLESIANKTIEKIEQAIPVEGIGIFLIRFHNEKLNIIVQKNCETISQSKLLIDYLANNSIMLNPLAANRSVEPGANVNFVEHEFIADRDFEIVIPIKSETNNLIGIIILKEKKSKTRYTVEDIDLLNSIADSVASAIERVELQEELLKEKLETERLEELNKIKSLFVSTVSHDLKTPLTSIKIFAEILQSNKEIPPEKMSEYLKIIEGESDRLTRLINNVLDYAKIEKGIKEYRFENVNINEVVKDVIKLMEYQLTIQKFHINIKLTDEEYLIRADKDAVAEALINLISNAIKYSEERREIFISTYISDNHFALSVQDKGIGIKESELTKILIPYFRSEEIVIKKKEGTGLGLTIIKHIMNAHNGEIKIESKRGEGSRFTLLFPLGGKDE